MPHTKDIDMRLICENHNFIAEHKSSDFFNKEIIKKVKYKITAVEQTPCKRTVVFLCDREKINLYIPLPFVQFYIVECINNLNYTQWIRACVSVTKSPFQNGTIVENLPLPNHNDGIICFGDYDVNILKIIDCVNVFWSTPFGADYFYNFSEFVKRNKINNETIAFDKEFIDSCKSFSDRDPFKLEYKENSFLNNLLKEIKI